MNNGNNGNNSKLSFTGFLVGVNNFANKKPSLNFFLNITDKENIDQSVLNFPNCDYREVSNKFVMKQSYVTTNCRCVWFVCSFVSTCDPIASYRSM